ncbi:hypothetical protein B0H63DRAFT_443119 [Podospora didyma]|uniref:Uncharacterized protein n=1 Tax=Podospora didyma TaxID=330526 RepID=A0AAE0P3P1_9PEZI|nr:hypothetical protein B0H63DRAFT_443119 [Podospora didyma]
MAHPSDSEYSTSDDESDIVPLDSNDADLPFSSYNSFTAGWEPSDFFDFRLSALHGTKGKEVRFIADLREQDVRRVSIVRDVAFSWQWVILFAYPNRSPIPSRAKSTLDGGTPAGIRSLCDFSNDCLDQFGHIEQQVTAGYDMNSNAVVPPSDIHLRSVERTHMHSSAFIQEDFLDFDPDEEQAKRSTGEHGMWVKQTWRMNALLLVPPNHIWPFFKASPEKNYLDLALSDPDLPAEHYFTSAARHAIDEVYSIHTNAFSYLTKANTVPFFRIQDCLTQVFRSCRRAEQRLQIARNLAPVKVNDCYSQVSEQQSLIHSDVFSKVAERFVVSREIWANLGRSGSFSVKPEDLSRMCFDLGQLGLDDLRDRWLQSIISHTQHLRDSQSPEDRGAAEVSQLWSYASIRVKKQPSSKAEDLRRQMNGEASRTIPKIREFYEYIESPTQREDRYQWTDQSAKPWTWVFTKASKTDPEHHEAWATRREEFKAELLRFDPSFLKELLGQKYDDLMNMFFLIRHAEEVQLDQQFSRDILEVQILLGRRRKGRVTVHTMMRDPSAGLADEYSSSSSSGGLSAE